MANTCGDNLGKAIISNCTTQGTGGIEVEAYAINRGDINVVTYDLTNLSKVSAITLKSGGKQAYKITGVNKNLNAGSDLVKDDMLANTYTHFFSLKGFEWDSASVENMDALDDVVIIYQRKDALINADGVFQILGLRTGLHKSTDTFRTNDANGTRSIELTSEAGETEPYSVWTFLDTDVATSKAALEALLTPTI